MATNMSSVTENLRAALLRDFKEFYREPSLSRLDGLDRIYTQDIEFHDPVRSLYGRLAVKNQLRGLLSQAHSVQMICEDEQIGDNSATLVWKMRFRHKKIKPNQVLESRGITLIRYTDRIYYQEDFFDMGSAVYQHIPLLGSVLRLVNRRIGG